MERRPTDLAALRRRYDVGRLLEADVPDDPLLAVRGWLHDAVQAGLVEPNAAALATSSPDGRPSVRHVLVKELDDRGFVFYTHADSRKGRELAANPWAALVFPWFAMARQVLVDGAVERVPREVALDYWRSRPYESQVGSAASAQSSVIATRDELEARAAAVQEAHPNAVPLPEDWGGYRVVPETVELWQGAPGRLHDRLRYRRADQGRWLLERLSP